MKLLIDVAQILKFENIALWSAFAAIFVFLIIAAVRGAFRGWIYGTYRFLFYAIIITVFLLTLDKFTTLIGGINLSRWITNDINVQINGEVVTATVGTLYSTLESFIVDLVHTFGLSIDPVQLVSLASAFATSFIKLVLLIVEGILLFTVINFIVWLLWHIAFKFFIPKAKRKMSYKKGRIISLVEEVLITVAAGAMVLVPITGTINSVVNNWSNSDETSTASIRADNQISQIVSSAFDTYNNSVFAKTFFSWTKDSNGQSFDTNLLSYFTKAEISEDLTISIVDVVSDVAKIGSTVIESGILSDEGTMFDKVYLLLTTEYGTKLISAVAQSKLVTAVLPFAFELLTNLDAVKGYLGNKLGIDYYAYDWSASLEEISGMLSDLQDSDFFSFFIDKDGAPTFDMNAITMLFSEKTKAAFLSLFDRLAIHPDEMNIFNDLVTVFLLNSALNAPSKEDGTISLDSFLPDLNGVEYEIDPETGLKLPTKLNDAYKNLSLGDEIKVLYNALYDINALDDRLMAVILSSLIDSEHALDTGVIFEIIVDNIEDITSIIAGNSIIDADPTKTCLMDCSFLTYAMKDLTKLIGKSVGEAMSVDLDLTSLSEELFSTSKPFETRKANAKTELKGLLNLVSSFASADPICKEFLKDLDGLHGIVFEPDGSLNSIETGLLNGFIALANGIDESRILTSILPKVANSFLTGADGVLSSLGISSLNLEIEGFGSHLASLLTVARDCMPLISYILQATKAMDGSSYGMYQVLSGLAEFADDSSGSSPILTLLNGICTNPLINDGTNANYKGLLENLFRTLLNDPSLTLPDTINPVVENNVVNDLIYALGTYTTPELLNALLSGGSISLEDLEGVELSEILKPLDSSEVFKDILADMLDDAILPLLGSNDISFKNVTSWEEEGEALEKLISYAVQVGDLSNIDFFNSDPESIGDIINSLSQNSLFDDNGEYVFGKFMYEKIIQAGDSIIDFLADRVIDPSMSVEEKTTTLKSDFVSMTKADWINESSVFADIIRHLQSLIKGGNLSSSLSLSDIDVNAFNPLFTSLTQSRSIGRVLSYHVFELIGKSLKSSGLDIGEGDYGNLNLNFVWEAWDNGDREKEVMANEIKTISSFFETLFDPSFGMSDPSSISLSISDLSGKFFVEPLFKSLGCSIIFNTLPNSFSGTELTAFESIVSTMIINSTIYGDADDPLVTSKVKSYIKNISPDDARYEVAITTNRLSSSGPWALEAMHLGECVDSVRNLSIDFNGLNINSIFKDESGDPLPEVEKLAKRVAFYDLISSLNECKTLYRALPMMIEKAINSVAGEIDALGSNPNYYYKGEGLSASPWGEDESENMSWIIYYVSSTDLSDSSIVGLDPENVTSLLTYLAKSHIFNSTEDGNGLTFFHGIMVNFFSKEEIVANYYRNENPKDNSLYNSITYTDAKTKAEVTMKELYPQVGVNDTDYLNSNLDYINGDEYSLKTFISLVQDHIADYTKLQAGQLFTISKENIKNFGLEISQNPLIADIFTNALAKMLTDSYNTLEIKLVTANPYYQYWIDTDGESVKPYSAEANYDNLIHPEEIERLVDLASSINDNQSIFNNLGNIEIDSNMIEFFKNTLTSLHDSYIFHEGKAWSDMGTMTLVDWRYDLTVFEQLYGLILNKSTIMDLNYDANIDGLTYANSVTKLHDSIKAFSEGTYSSSHSGNWVAEIEALTNDGLGGGLINILLNEGVISSKLSEMSSFDISSMSPTLIGKILKAISKVDLTKDIVPYKLRSLFNDTVKFNAYSTYTFDLAISGDFDSSIDLGYVGEIVSLTVLGTGSINLSYSMDGISWSENSSFDTGDKLDLDNCRYFKLSPTDGSSITALKNLEVDTANYFLDQETYTKDNGTIDGLVSFLDTLFTLGGGSYPDLKAGDSSSTTALLSIFTPLLDWIDNDNAFYSLGYDSMGKSLTNYVSYTSRDIFMRNAMKFTYHNAEYGMTVTLDSGRHFEGTKPLDIYSNINSIFEDPTYNSSTEGGWLTDHIVSLEVSEFALGDNVPHLSYMGNEIPSYHMVLEQLVVSEASLGSPYSYALEEIIGSGTSSMFGYVISQGLFEYFVEQTAAYGASGSYFKLFALFDPNDDATRMSAVSNAIVEDGDVKSLADINDANASNLIKNVLDLTKAYGLKTIIMGTSSETDAKAVFETMEAQRGSISSNLFRIYNYFYDAAGYEFMLNHNKYYSKVILGVPVTLSYPDAFVTGFSYNDVASLL